MTHSRFSRSSLPHRFALAPSLIGLFAATPLFARPTQPSTGDRQITLAVATLMERDHLTGHHLDNEMSERTLKSFVKDLDPLKLFFYQSDIDDFNRSQAAIDDQLKHGDIRFAYD